MIDDLVKFIKEHWAIALVVCILIVPSVWFAMDYFYRTRLEEKDAEIHALREAARLSERQREVTTQQQLPSGSSSTVSIPPSAFTTQLGDEFILSMEINTFGLPKRDDTAGVDLTEYDLEFTFTNAHGKKIQLWYKDSKFNNVYSWPYSVQGEQPIRFNPFAEGARNVDQFNDFTHIYAIGAKVIGGLSDVQISSVRLIRRD